MNLKDVEEGRIASWYTKEKWFCTVTPAFGIDRVKFDFVLQGTNGQGFSVYVEVDDFEVLCDKILDRRFERAIEADKQNNYPEAWNYVTGNNGCKEIHLGAGRGDMLVIQGRDKTKGDSENAFVGIMGYDELWKMAREFRRTSAAYLQEKAKKCVKNSERYRDSQKNYSNESEQEEPLY